MRRKKTKNATKILTLLVYYNIYNLSTQKKAAADFNHLP